MNGSQLKARLERIEALTEEARRDPEAFRAELRRLMRLGRVYVLAVLGLLVTILVASVVAIPAGGGLASVFLLWIVGGMAYFVFSAMRQWSKAPHGVPIKRSEVPHLFDLIDRARREAGLKNIHRIHVTDDFNAAVTITRSRGVFGKRQNYLVVGLPLMHALPTEELHAVLAHECAHLSDRQAGDLVGIWQLQSVWQNVAINMLRGNAFGGFLFRPFFRWFLPRFIERSLVFTREMELDADHHGMTQTDAETSIRLEIRLAVAGLKLDDLYTEKLLELQGEESEPPAGLTALKCELASKPLTDDDQRYLALALAQTTGWRDTHPALRDRLATYDFDAADATMPPSVQRSSAYDLLGGHGDALAKQVDEELRPRLIGWWMHRHSVVAKELEQLRFIEHDLRFGEIADADRRTRAMLIARYRPSDSHVARQELEQVVDVETEQDPAILFALGKLRLRDGDESGVQLLERAAKLKPELSASTHQEVGTFHAAEGRHEEAEEALKAATTAQDSHIEQQVERFVVADTMPVEAHKLDRHATAALVAALEREKDVAEAWLAKKTLSQETHRPVFVLMVRDDLEGKALFTGKARQKLFEGLNQRVSLGNSDVMIVPLVEPLYGLWQNMRELDGAHVYLKRGEQPFS